LKAVREAKKLKCQDHASTVASSSTWVRFGRMCLSFSDQNEIAGGVQLNDKHADVFPW